MTNARDTSDHGLNPLCIKCLRPCKQPVSSLLVECPRFYPLPFKVEKHRYAQMELFHEKNKKK